jgi:hypothetical protein
LLLKLCLYSSAITDVGIRRISECCPKLQSLSLAYSKRISEMAIYKIAECCPILQYLYLSYPANFIETCNLTRIRECCQMLQYLHLHCRDGSNYRFPICRALP